MRRLGVIGGAGLAGVYGLLLLTSSCAESKQGEEAGVIQTCAGGVDHYRLSRGGRTLPVKLLMTVLEGDKIIVEQEGGALIIGYPDGEIERITRSNSPFWVKLHGRPVSLSAKLLSFLGWKAGKDVETLAAPQGTRGDKATLAWLVPGLSDGSARVVQGDRRLGVAWSGGYGPFHVTVKALDGPVLLDATQEAAELLAVEPHRLGPGQYEVAVEDVTGRLLAGSFTVVDTGPALAVEEEPPAWLGTGGVRVIRARALAEKDGGAWCYEAYLSLIGVEEDFGVKSSFPLVKRLRQEICD